jgi:hypothetical protein
VTVASVHAVTAVLRAAAGFTVIKAEFLSASTSYAKGKEHAGIVAEKPSDS